MQEYYSFFFDETFHDRKIRLKECGEINTLRTDTLDNYIGLFWGCKKAEAEANRQLLQRFEEKYRKFYKLNSDQELKSTLIAKKNFKYGIGSFNDETFLFYRDLFLTLEMVNPIIQIDMISKMELYLRDVFSHVKFEYPLIMNETAFYYSLTKFIIYYHTPALLQKMWKANDVDSLQEFVDALVDALEKVSIAGERIDRKQLESHIFSQLAFFIETAEYTEPIPVERDFCYDTCFEGLDRLLKEKQISNESVSVYVDNENKTFEAAQNRKYGSLSQLDSKESIEVRTADWLAGFVGRIIHAMMIDDHMREDAIYSYDDFSDVDLESRRMLSEKWFILTEEQFDLYRLVFEVLVKNQSSYWAAMTLSYGDQCALFYSLLRYFNRYKTFEDYNRVHPEEHVEYFNADCCIELQRYYDTFK